MPCSALGRSAKIPTKRGQAALTEERLRQLKVPKGFAVSLFAQNLDRPGQMQTAADGTIYVLCGSGSKIAALRDAGGAVCEPKIALSGLTDVQTFCLHNDKLYFVSGNALRVAVRRSDGTFGATQTLMDTLPVAPERVLAFGPDGKLYLAVSSEGIAFSPECGTLLRMNPNGSEPTIFARGLQNTSAFDWNPDTGALYGVDKTAGRPGQDIAEEINLLEEGKDYSRPQEPREHNALAAALTAAGRALPAPPAMTCPANSNAVGMVFYREHAFAPEYWNDAFVAMRGSDDTTSTNGYRVARLHFRGGKLVRCEDFVTGFLVNKGHEQFARLAGITAAKDGSLLVSDDENGVIYRIAQKE